MPSRDPLRLLFACALVAAAACRKPSAPGGGGGGFSLPPTPVEIATVASGPVADRFHAVGTVEAGESVEIVSEVEGRALSLPFREGERVDKGALLVQLDDAQWKAEAARAEALVEQSRLNFERTRRIVAEKVGSEQALDDATAALRVAEANLELARVKLAKARIVAPFAGVLGARLVSPGAWVKAADVVIARLSDTSEVKIAFAAPERYLAALHPGAEVSVSTAAFPGEAVAGKVDLVEPVVDPATRNVRVRARVPNPDGRLRPGLSADVSVVLAERPRALTIPGEAVFAEGDRFFVYLVKPDSSVAKTAVALGPRTSEAVEVLSGLAAGQRVVRAGHQKLFEGARVQPAEDEAAPPSPGALAPAAGSAAK